MGKKVLWNIQDVDDVSIRTRGKQFYRGDILVGADGAYYAVRQSMFKELKGQRKLPKSDDAPLPHSCVLSRPTNRGLEPRGVSRPAAAIQPVALCPW